MDLLHYSSAESSSYIEQAKWRKELREKYPPQDETCFMGYGKVKLKDFLEAQENDIHKVVKIYIKESPC